MANMSEDARGSMEQPAAKSLTSRTWHLHAVLSILFGLRHTSQISNFPGLVLFQKGLKKDPSRGKSPKPNGLLGYNGIANGWKVLKSRSKFSIRPWYPKKRPREALRLGIKISVIREHPNSLTSFFPPQSDALHRDISQTCARNCWPWKHWVKSCIWYLLIYLIYLEISSFSCTNTSAIISHSEEIVHSQTHSNISNIAAVGRLGLPFCSCSVFLRGDFTLSWSPFRPGTLHRRKFWDTYQALRKPCMLKTWILFFLASGLQNA